MGRLDSLPYRTGTRTTSPCCQIPTVHKIPIALQGSPTFLEIASRIFGMKSVSQSLRNCSLSNLGSILTISVRTSESSVRVKMEPKMSCTLSVRSRADRTTGFSLSSNLTLNRRTVKETIFSSLIENYRGRKSKKKHFKVMRSIKQHKIP